MNEGQEQMVEITVEKIRTKLRLALAMTSQLHTQLHGDLRQPAAANLRHAILRAEEEARTLQPPTL